MKKKLALCLFLFVFLFNVYSEEQNEFSFILGADNHLLVFGTVHNTTGYFIIDTGSIDIILFDAVQDLPETISRYDSYTMLGETFESKNYIVSGITLGNSIINENFTIIQAPETIKALFPTGIKGLINIWALDNKAVEISFSEQKIRLLDDVPAAYKENVAFIRDGVFCFIPITINNTQYLFRIDTGSNTTIGFPEILLNAIDKKNIYQVAVSRYNIETNYNSYYIFKNANFTLFNHNYKNCIARTSIFNDKENFGIIGMEILKNYDMVFDPLTQKIFYKPLLSDVFYDAFLSYEAWTTGLFSVGYTEDALVAKEIIINSPVWKAGLRPDQKITKIDNYDGAGISKEYIMGILRTHSKVKFEYYNEDNKKKTIKVKPKLLLK